jgi:hypothetical protein
MLLDRLRRVAEAKENAVRAYATVGEICLLLLLSAFRLLPSAS